MDAITRTNFSFPGQKDLYIGKVRDVYNIENKYLMMVVSDRSLLSMLFYQRESLLRGKY